MSFDYHSDTLDHPAFLGENGLAAMGLWVQCGSWTSAHGRSGVVPAKVAREIAGGDMSPISKLVDNGLWRETPDGYEMLRGPSTDLPLPLWRYGDKDDDGSLISVDPDSTR